MTRQQYSNEYIFLGSFEEKFNYCVKHGEVVQDELEKFVLHYQKETDTSLRGYKIGKSFRVFNVKPTPKTESDHVYICKYHINNSQSELIYTNYNPMSIEQYKQYLQTEIERETNVHELLIEEIARFEKMSIEAAEEIGEVKYKGVYTNSFTVMRSILRKNEVDYRTIYHTFVVGRTAPPGKTLLWSPYDEAKLLFIIAQCLTYLKNQLELLSNSTSEHLHTSFKINLTGEQLAELYQKLVNGNHLKSKNIKHFINAFSGKRLTPDFEPIEWSNPTFGAIFIDCVTKRENPWKKLEPLMKTANYKKLLSQSKNSDTYNNTVDLLKNLIDL